MLLEMQPPVHSRHSRPTQHLAEWALCSRSPRTAPMSAQRGGFSGLCCRSLRLRECRLRLRGSSPWRSYAHGAIVRSCQAGGRCASACQSARQMRLGIRVIPRKAVGVRHRVLRHNLRHGFSKQPFLDRHLQLLAGQRVGNIGELPR